MAEADCRDGGETNEIKTYERFSSTTSGVTFMSNVTDEEYDLLPLPEVDEDFLDDELLQDDNSREGTEVSVYTNVVLNSFVLRYARVLCGLRITISSVTSSS